MTQHGESNLRQLRDDMAFHKRSSALSNVAAVISRTAYAKYESGGADIQGKRHY